MRAKAGRFIALLYLLCVLAPGAVLALGDAASCHVQPFGASTAAHLHEDVQPDHAPSHQHHEMQADQHAMHHADADDAMPKHARHQHDGKDSPGPCCARLCVSAITADLPAVANLSPPVSLCISENFQRLPGGAPPLLYRPPIA